MPNLRAARILILTAAGLAGGAVAGCRRASLPPRPDGAAVVTAEVPAAVDPDVAFAPETEPNDTLETAQALGPLAAGRPIGVIAALKTAAPGRADSDWYRVELPPAADAGPGTGADGAAEPRPALSEVRIVLRPESAMGPTLLEAYDGDGNKLLAAVGGRRDPAEVITIPNLARGAGTFALRVRSAGPTSPGGGYRLSVRVSPLERGAEVEPNGTPELAGRLEPGGEAVGYFGWTGDDDWYLIPTGALAEGSVLFVDLDGVSGTSPRIQVFGGLAEAQRPGAKRAALADAAAPEGERLALRNLRIPQTAAGGPAAGAADVFLHLYASGSNPSERYRLRVRAELPRPGAESEPNNDPAHAQAIGDGTVEGFLSRGDVDVYRYTGQGPVELEVELTPPGGANAKLMVTTDEGRVLARAEARRRSAHLSPISVPDGRVLIRVSAGAGAPNPDEPYRLTVTSRAPGTGPAPGASGERAAP